MTESISNVDCDKQPETQNFHLAVIEFEEKLIRQAMAEANNKPTAAARLLGLNTHQTLLAMLDSRHKKLRDELGIAKRPRRKSGSSPTVREGSTG
jgi:transcriptional regulator with GAF, ATPase, and Fis domain